MFLSADLHQGLEKPTEMPSWIQQWGQLVIGWRPA